ncbi:P-loop containing nucleoside triphosphate hydrolase protein [Suillus fuscotomentosus]|uniref:P-loop containing nucleoside triphosphate hydrolase protein n=1 Tax=Suillus fuscotomentosus TaxID=1912939 RepID=A0AAD4DRH1_9AGAM|nr:P-loop containing nucleoside triphosphate hydrolase protein [Suillus fuscotomentosus]XP_041220687.1 P-loop containing nucleoside triphosphate hydrolase protein [Suillus fuscotomentosus]XP_041220688.1 P-loop containing nucleoside triphosphate hydrolase protein [Suillus fuscotomentosus]KAG1891683.1 P-loop containing nucleoside triphosphate hydrolase protein [Suillus fuscotomentosus]KAG1895111.1 P-loop containing nucleoside triphosphate hydrolase protein [Suillus fuscotomentosus]KAG1895112.1 P
MSDSHDSTDTIGNKYSQQGHQGRPRNVVLYGESGVGKSSLINLIMGRDAAKTSPDALACTTTHAPYDATISGQHFRLWDTAGFNEGSEGTVPAVMAERNLTAFLRGLNQEDGVHLLIYCTHYKIFSAVIRDSKVPTIIVVTCLEDFRPVMAEWWNENKDELATYGMQFSGYACVTTLKDEPTESPDIHQRHAQSYNDVCRSILDHCSQTPHKTWGTEDQRSFLAILLQKLARFVGGAHRDQDALKASLS